MSNTYKADTNGITQEDLREYHNNKVAPFIGQNDSSSGHIVEDEEGTALTKRKVLSVNSPLTVEDDSTNEKTIIGADTSGALDLSKFIPPGQRTPDEFEVAITNPQEGQVIRYNATTEQWENGNGGVPVGTIINFFGYTAPSGYLVCDGTEYAKADYPYLATHLADLDDHYSTTAYVGSDSDHFKVPDLRGEFLRGTGTNGHTNQGDGANVGVHQDATQDIYFETGSDGRIQSYSTSSGYVNALNTDSKTDSTGSGNYKRIVSGSIVNTTGESSFYTSRPTNTSVLYCIKYN